MEPNGFPTGADPQVVSEAADEAEVELLVAHEVALREFARREIAGRSDDSLALIEALPHMN